MSTVKVVVAREAGGHVSLDLRSWRSEARAIEGKYRGGIVATKNILDLNHPAWAVPAPFLALLLS